ncbi:MAG: hypothetical protein MJK10_11805 [Pseudomonadales bacterium]|nr:hypothetical protein [Pseudomonadales bacterium]NRA16703.1 hypothetical protein [Oceanospirillaceae bacterium]
MALQLTLNSGINLEFAIGKVTKGKEMQVFAEYFPLINPVLAEYATSQLGSFSITATNKAGVVPEMGSLTNWSCAEDYNKFHNDPRFIKIKPLRDDALDLLWDGHFFISLDKVVDIDTDVEYALVIAEGNPIGLEPILNLPSANDSPRQAYAGKSMSLHLWSDAAEQLLTAAADEAEVFRIRFNAPAA